MSAVKKQWLTFTILAALTGACGDDGGGNNDGDNTGGGATAGQTAGNGSASAGQNAGTTAGDDAGDDATAGGGTNAGTTAGNTTGGTDAGSTTSGGKDAGSTTGATGLPDASKCGAQANGAPLDTSAMGGCYYFYCYQTKETLLSEATQGGKCANEKDAAIQCEGESVRTVADCARSEAATIALGIASFKTAVKKCVRKNAKLSDLSEGCLDCNVESSACAATSCLADCVSGDSVKCDQCRETNKCTPKFYECAGLPDPKK